MKKTLLSALLSASLICTNPLSSHGSTEGAMFRARQILDALLDRGWTVNRYYDKGLLARGQSVNIYLTLNADVTYKIVAGGCEDAYDVDAVLYDEGGNLISRDRDRSSLAVVDVTPRWTGPFILRVTMYDSTPSGAHYVVQYAWE
jgi:hypothetical protein